MSEVEQDYSGKKVIIGLTGRLDSCVAALLLKKQGMDVIGMSIVMGNKDTFEGESLAPKCHINDLDQVKRFCEKINIPFYATDAKSRFDSDVLDPLIARKLSAEANNSCFDCTRMRIHTLYDKMKKLNADFIATGHYCKIQKNLNSSQYFVHSNNDLASDQSFLLAGLDGEFLKHLILPLGELKKSEVQKIAIKFGLGNEESKDSTEFCFKRKESFIGKIGKRVPKNLIKDGQIQNIDTELYHGDHAGIMNHYLGEDQLPFKGLGPTDKELQIVDYVFHNGLIIIGPKKELTHKGVQLVNLKLGKGLDQTRPIVCFLKSKHDVEYHKCNLYFKNNNSAMVECESEIYPLLKSESFVLFDKNTRNAKVIGIGKACNIGDFELLDRVGEYKSYDGEEEKQEVTSVQMFKF